MPMPESATSNVTPTIGGMASAERRRRLTKPSVVNFVALPTRLSKTCLTRCESVSTQSSTPSSIVSDRCKPFASAFDANSAMTEFAIACREAGAYDSVSLPASILEWSRTSLRIAMSDDPDEAAVLTRPRWCRSRTECRSRSRAPRTPFIGVRISWLMVARNCDLAWLAASAASLATCSDATAASATRLCRMACLAVDENSLEARNMVIPNAAISVPSKTDTGVFCRKRTITMLPSSGTANKMNERPTSDKKKAAIAIPPQANTAYAVAYWPSR